MEGGGGTIWILGKMGLIQEPNWPELSSLFATHRLDMI